MTTFSQDADALERMAKFPKGKPADPTKNMNPEQKAEWEAMNAEHGDKFKTACGDMIDYFSKNPEKLKEKQMRDKAKNAGSINGPGIPDGTGPHGGTPECQLSELANMDLELMSEALPGNGLDRDLAALDDLGRVAAIDRAANSQIGKTIIEQMGGRRAMQMIGAKQIIWLKDGVRVMWPNKQRSKGNCFEVHLNSADEYDLEFYNVNIRAKKLVKKYRGVQWDQLSKLFEQQTGWYLRMAADQLKLAKGDEQTAKFEEGDSADPTENMSEEDAKKWRLENLKNKDNFTDKKGTFDEGTSRAPDGWDSGHIEGDPEATKSDEGSETPDGDGNVEKRARKAAVQFDANVGPAGMYRHKWSGTFPHGYASKWFRGALSFDRPAPKQDAVVKAMVTTAKGTQEEGMVLFKPLFGDPLGFLIANGDSTREAQRMLDDAFQQAWDKAPGGRTARSGLYGFTKRVQADCETTVRKVQKAALRIARQSYGKNAKVAQFLTTHAARTDSLPAHILVAALSELGPKVATDMTRQARLEELRSQRSASGDGNEELRQKAGKAPRGKVQQAIMAAVEKAGSSFDGDLSKMAQAPAFRGIHFAKILSAAETLAKKGMIKFDGVKMNTASDDDSVEGGRSWGYGDKHKPDTKYQDREEYNLPLAGEPGSRQREKYNHAYRMKVCPDQPGNCGLGKEAAKSYGLYGFSNKVANLGLQACTDVRADAGRIAYDLHRRRAAKHARITAFLDQHNKEANCRYSRLLHASYPNADTKVAALVPPTTVAGWLAWED